MKKKIFWLLPLTIGWLSGCSNERVITKRYPAFNVAVEVSLFEGDSKHFAEIEKIIKTTNRMVDTYSSTNGEAYLLNQNKEAQISDDFASLLGFCADFNAKTNGLFNVLISPLKTLWDPIYSGTSDVLPSADEIAEAVNDINESEIMVEGNTARLIGPALLEFGAVGKGYCLSKIKDYLDENKVSKYKIDAGFSSILLGESGSSSGFNVSIEDCDYEFKAQSTSISTSSIFKQSQAIDGVVYSHIINPVTGSCTPKYDCVVVTCPNPLVGDALSTVCMMMDTNEIEELIEQYPCGLRIFSDGELIYSVADNG